MNKVGRGKYECMVRVGLGSSIFKRLILFMAARLSLEDDGGNFWPARLLLVGFSRARLVLPAFVTTLKGS